MDKQEKRFALTETGGAVAGVEARTLHATWGGAEITLALPMPSQAAIDAVFRRYGGVIVWALIALAVSAVGVVAVVAMGDGSSYEE